MDLIEKICPDVIHFDDFVEFFVDDNIIQKLYSEDRPYFIVETCHSSNVSPMDKVYCPDKFIMVNRWMCDKFSVLGVPVDVLEYPIENFERPDREEALRSLGLDPNRKHVVNVGLFTPGKNQGELIEYAKGLQHLPVDFHFLGNTELNPIVIKETLSWDLPILMRRLEPYGDTYDNNPLVGYLSLNGMFTDKERNINLIKERLQLK